VGPDQVAQFIDAEFFFSLQVGPELFAFIAVASVFFVHIFYPPQAFIFLYHLNHQIVKTVIQHHAASCFGICIRTNAGAPVLKTLAGVLSHIHKNPGSNPYKYVTLLNRYLAARISELIDRHGAMVLTGFSVYNA
jgi:hypothetical protein